MFLDSDYNIFGMVKIIPFIDISENLNFIWYKNEHNALISLLWLQVEPVVAYVAINLRFINILTTVKTSGSHLAIDLYFDVIWLKVYPAVALLANKLCSLINWLSIKSTVAYGQLTSIFVM